MVSFRMSGNPTIYGLLALSAMEIAASQKPGSPFAILQQPTKGFTPSSIAVSPQPTSAPPQQVSSPIPGATIPIAEQAPTFAELDLSSTTTQDSPEIHPAVPATAASFRDLQSHWSQPFVEILAARGIVSGYTDGTFQPDRDIQASHFSMMLHQAKIYRIKAHQRDLGIISSTTAQVSLPYVNGNLRVSVVYPIQETEAEVLLRAHDIRTRAQAAVFIYRDLQGPIVSQASVTESLATQTPPVPTPWQRLEPTFSEEQEKRKSPGLSEKFQWSVIEPNWIAQG